MLTAEENEACAYIIELVLRRSGIRLSHGKSTLVQARLGKRMTRLGLATLSEYCDLLRTEGNDDESTFVVEALTTNFTGFLREASHFDFLVGTALPQVLLPGEKRIRAPGAARARSARRWRMTACANVWR